jgi:pectate lyase
MRTLLAILLAAPLAAADLPAFPGAEGFGASTPGGRGGRVLFVTNLNDHGPGSFRAACETAGPRIVIFRVGGIIDLESPLHVKQPYLTVAGQTAPGDGICLRNYEFSVDTHDVVVRYLRSRAGEGAGREVDAIDISHGSRNVVLDHCSASWSVDECLSLSGDVQNVTVQWSIIAEGLNRSVHKKGRHGYGSLARANGPVTWHHNLWAHHDSRNPRMGDNYGKPPFPTFDFRNNVIYDYGGTASGLTQGILKINYVANFIRPGPSSRARLPLSIGSPSDIQIFVRDNVWDDHPAATADNRAFFDPTEKQVRLLETPIPAPGLTVTSARAALEAVLEGAGALLPVRDAVDRRIVAEVRNRQGRILDSTRDVGGWPAYRSAPPPVDTDGDGIPDEWEALHRLNPRDPSDGARPSGDGYTWIERYLNSISSPPR